MFTKSIVYMLNASQTKNILTFFYVMHIIIKGCLREVMDLMLDEKKMAVIFKAFCDENRIRILKMLATGEKCGCKLLEEINVTQPTLSHHMKILCDSGVVTGRKEGKWTHYSISPQGARMAVQCLQELTCISGSNENMPCCEK